MHMSHMKLIPQNVVVSHSPQPQKQPPTSAETFVVDAVDENSGRGRKAGNRRGEEEAKEPRGDGGAASRSKSAGGVEASGITTTQAVEALLARQTAHALCGQHDGSAAARGPSSQAAMGQEGPLGDLLSRLASRR